MGTDTLESWYLSLKDILETLETHPEVEVSPHLSERIHTALLFLAEAGKLVEGTRQETDELRQKLSDCLGLKDHIEKFNAILPHYENMVKAGANAEFIAKVALLENLDIIHCYKLLRILFKLELEEARDIVKRIKQ